MEIEEDAIQKHFSDIDVLLNGTLTFNEIISYSNMLSRLNEKCIALYNNKIYTDLIVHFPDDVWVNIFNQIGWDLLVLQKLRLVCSTWDRCIYLIHGVIISESFFINQLYKFKNLKMIKTKLFLNLDYTKFQNLVKISTHVPSDEDLVSKCLVRSLPKLKNLSSITLKSKTGYLIQKILNSFIQIPNKIKSMHLYSAYFYKVDLSPFTKLDRLSLDGKITCFINSSISIGFMKMRNEVRTNYNGYGIIISDHSVYHGDIRDGTKSGKGREIYRMGQIYEGEFLNGLPDGKGIYQSAYANEISEVIHDGGELIKKSEIWRPNNMLDL